MTIKTIFPYIRRLKRSKPKLKAFVKEHGDKYLKEVSDSGLFDVVSSDDPNGADLVVLAYKKLKREEIFDTDYWEKMAVDGWVVLTENDGNFNLASEFRKSKKITSLLTHIDGIIYFQKEDYSGRQSSQDVPPELLEMPNNLSDPLDIVPDFKNSHVKDAYLYQFGNGDVFIETGTYLGQTVELVRRSARFYKHIISIELDRELHRNAKSYFSFDNRIKVFRGDSVDRIAKLCKALKNRPATFWLDAHASGPLPGGKTGPNPLVEELTAIKNTGRTDHTIMIDDRRLFGSAEWGGLKEEAVMDLLKQINPDYKITYLDGEIPNDIICASVVDNGPYVPPLPKAENELPEEVKKLFKITGEKPEKTDPNKPRFIFMD